MATSEETYKLLFVSYMLASGHDLVTWWWVSQCHQWWLPHLQGSWLGPDWPAGPHWSRPVLVTSWAPGKDMRTVTSMWVHTHDTQQLWGHVTEIYHVYTRYIPCIYQTGDDITVIYQEYSLYILHCIYLEYTLYILHIYIVYQLYIQCIYQVCTWNMLCILIVYTQYVNWIYIVYYVYILHPDWSSVPFHKCSNLRNESGYDINRNKI